MLATTYCQGFGRLLKLLVPEGSCYGWPFYEALVILVTTLSVAFPCLEYYSMEVLAEHALALRHQHLWCLTTTSVTCGLVSVQLSTSMECTKSINGLWCILSCSAQQ